MLQLIWGILFAFIGGALWYYAENCKSLNVIVAFGIASIICGAYNMILAINRMFVIKVEPQLGATNS